MRFIKWSQSLWFFLGLVWSCGSSDESIVKDILYNIDDNQVDVGVEFEDVLELELELSVPIKKYGSLDFIPAGRKSGFILGFSLDLSIFNDDDMLSLKKTRKLPNGQRMSRYVDTELIWLRFKKSNKIRPSLYLGAEVENYYLGAAIELGFMDDDFPANLTISQRLKNPENQPIGVITLYGPKVEDDKIKVPGGLFFATNISDLIEYSEEDNNAQKLDSGQLKFETINEPIEVRKDGHLIEMSDEEIYKLAKKFNKRLKKFNKDQK